MASIADITVNVTAEPTEEVKRLLQGIVAQVLREAIEANPSWVQNFEERLTANVEKRLIHNARIKTGAHP